MLEALTFIGICGLALLGTIALGILVLGLMDALYRGLARFLGS